MSNIAFARNKRQAAAAEKLIVTATSRVNNEAAWRQAVESSNKGILACLRAGLTVPNVADLAIVSRQHVDKLARESGEDFPAIRRRS